jgi:hypothetical protein
MIPLIMFRLSRPFDLLRTRIYGFARTATVVDVLINAKVLVALLISRVGLAGASDAAFCLIISRLYDGIDFVLILNVYLPVTKELKR